MADAIKQDVTVPKHDGHFIGVLDSCEKLSGIKALGISSIMAIFNIEWLGTPKIAKSYVGVDFGLFIIVIGLGVQSKSFWLLSFTSTWVGATYLGTYKSG